ncbi:CIA30 family protein [Ferrimonas futtsuensis]|uniref:CIA30 family protein n=1 Tax=Ferrimonas futtsuensis TaxID=364764 RepID=UPI00040F9A09|nr:CIA30 family protein [Ferrimonas futtsuensis]
MELVDFLCAEEAGRWRPINDGVMGGVSQSQMVATEQGCCFEGVVSLENGGGFASMRRPLVLPEGCRALRLTLRGDGNSYQLRLKMDGLCDGVLYVAGFATQPGRDEVIELPLSEFEPRFRGRTVAGAEPLDENRVEQLGLLMGQGQSGPFALNLYQLTAVSQLQSS